MKLEEVQDKLCIIAAFLMFCLMDFYILIKGYCIVYKEKYFNRK